MLRVDEGLEDSALFKRICELARNQDIDALRLMKNEHYFPAILGSDGKSTIYRLAFAGHDDAVELLIRVFDDGVRNNPLYRDAAKAYAKAKRVDKVLEFAERGAAMVWPIYWFAKYGMVGAVEQLLRMNLREDLMDNAALGYAEKGYVREAEDLCSRGAGVYALVKGFAAAGMLEKVNEWIEQDVVVYNRYMAAEGFSDSGYFDDEDKALKTLSHLDTKAARRGVLNSVGVEMTRELRKTWLLQQSEKTNSIMRKYDINFEQARALQIKGIREWMLQSRQIFNDRGAVVNDLFFTTVMHATGLSRQDAEGLYRAVCKNTLDGAKERILTSKPDTLFARRYGTDGMVRAVRHKRETEALERHYDSKMQRIV